MHNWSKLRRLAPAALVVLIPVTAVAQPESASSLEDTAGKVCGEVAKGKVKPLKAPTHGMKGPVLVVFYTNIAKDAKPDHGRFKTGPYHAFRLGTVTVSSGDRLLGRAEETLASSIRSVACVGSSTRTIGFYQGTGGYALETTWTVNLIDWPFPKDGKTQPTKTFVRSPPKQVTSGLEGIAGQPEPEFIAWVRSSFPLD